MSNIACEMLPGGGFIMRRAEECSEADRAKNFYCIHCRVRVYLHISQNRQLMKTAMTILLKSTAVLQHCCMIESKGIVSTAHTRRVYDFPNLNGVFEECA